MLYSYTVLGWSEVNEVLSTRNDGELTGAPETGCNVTSEPRSIQAIFAVVPETLTTNGPPATCSAAAMNCAAASAVMKPTSSSTFRMKPGVWHMRERLNKPWITRI